MGWMNLWRLRRHRRPCGLLLRRLPMLVIPPFRLSSLGSEFQAVICRELANVVLR